MVVRKGKLWLFGLYCVCLLSKYIFMNQFYEQRENQKSRRNYSDLEAHFPQVKNQSDLASDKKYLRPKPNSIKINRSKLPPDFFPRTESLKRKISPSRPSLANNNIYLRDLTRKVQSERMHASPEKTSFFGFFEETSQTNNYANTINLKRKFDSRQDPKRDKLIFQNRNFTPMTGIQRGGLTDFLQSDPETSLGKVGKISPRKEHLLKYKQVQQTINEQNEKEKYESMQNSPRKINLFECKMNEEEMHNITFFNAKSTSFPPINKNPNIN